MLALWSYHFALLAPVDLIEIVNLLSCLPLWIASCCKTLSSPKRWWRPTLSWYSHFLKPQGIMARPLSSSCLYFPPLVWRASHQSMKRFFLVHKTVPVCWVSPLSRPRTIRGQFRPCPKADCRLKNVSIPKYWQTQKHVISHCLWIMEWLPRGASPVIRSFPPPL